jgi:hypothetical protein
MEGIETETNVSSPMWFGQRRRYSLDGYFSFMVLVVERFGKAGYDGDATELEDQP